MNVDEHESRAYFPTGRAPLRTRQGQVKADRTGVIYPAAGMTRNGRGFFVGRDITDQMHAYRLTDDEAFQFFAADARAALLANCTCHEPNTGAQCDACRHVDAVCKRMRIEWDEWIETKSRMMARRKMKRRRV